MAATLTWTSCRAVTDEGSDTNDNPDVTLPSGNASGDRAYVMVETSAQADAQPDTPAGWSVASAVVTTGTTMRTTIFYKDLSGSDDGANPVFTISSGARRWTIAGFIVRGWTGTPQISSNSTNTSSTLIPVGDVTPSADNMLRVAVGAYRINGTTSGVTVTMTADGFTGVDQAYGTQATASRYGCFLASKQLVGQSGVDQTDINFTSSTACATKRCYSLTFEPAPVGVSPVLRRRDPGFGLLIR